MDNNNNLCIEDIMREIRQEIKDKNLTDDMLSFEDIPYKKALDVSSSDSDETDSALMYLNSHFNVQPYKELKGNALSVFIKKVIRKLTKFYVEPVVFEQNQFNANAVKVMNSFNKNKNNLDTQELLKKIEILELSQKNLIKRIESLDAEIKVLKEKK
ncbi:MAG: hypothetical protein K2G63_06055 [Oscillospiraceae bacterium]|nr:hypothetical protein [Oscillospiraceae bacterium]